MMETRGNLFYIQNKEEIKMLKKFNKLINETLEAITNKESAYTERLKKCDEIYNFNCKISDLPDELKVSLNEKINKYVKEALHNDKTKSSATYRVYIIFYYDGKWYQRSAPHCEDFNDEFATFYLYKEFFKKDDKLEGEIKVPINDIIITRCGGTLSTKSIIEIETDKYFDEENVKKQKDSLSFPEKINVLIDKGFIKKEEIINAFYHKKKSFYRTINLKDLIADSDGESIIKNYFKVDTNDSKFKTALKDLKYDAETQAHTYCIFLNLNVSIDFDLSKPINEQEFPCKFTYSYSHNDPIINPGF